MRSTDDLLARWRLKEDQLPHGVEAYSQNGRAYTDQVWKRPSDDLLGQGGFGTVWLEERSGTGNSGDRQGMIPQVRAIKTIRKQPGITLDVRELTELKAMMAFSDPEDPDHSEVLCFPSLVWKIGAICKANSDQYFTSTNDTLSYSMGGTIQQPIYTWPWSTLPA